MEDKLLKGGNYKRFKKGSKPEYGNLGPENFVHPPFKISGSAPAQRKNSSPWFNNDCVIARAELKRDNKLFRKYRSQEFHDLVVNSRKHYHKVKRRARSIYKQEKMQRLHKMATDNPREFWREIKRMKGSGSSQCEIELSDFYQLFKHVFFR